ncbi:MAG: FtsQ-type POTRA domain-containing protein [Deltaproteobacteria bacterium]|nr:FtsQ-type POTRA domain-containing protein [Deltaproteobacteria bacterium]
MVLKGRKNRRRIDQAAVRAAAQNVAVRTLKGLGVVALLVGICVATAFGADRGKTYLYTSPTFAIEELSFEGTRHADENELTRLSGIALGDNLFQADLLAAERAMSAHPWVRRVSVEREYPRKLVVRVIEHEPAALADLGGLYYLDAAGHPFKKLAPGEEGDWPILRGVTREEYVAHEGEIEGLFQDALGALAAYGEAGLEKVAPLSEVRVDRVDGLTFFCGPDAVAVKLGQGEWREKFTKLEQLLTELSRKGAKAEVIRLDNRTRPGWVAVQLAQGGGQD